MSVEKRPTKKQTELLAYIDGFIRGNGYGPSYREIMRALDYKSVSTVAIHIDGLIKKGKLRKKGSSARSLEVIRVKELAEIPKKSIKTSEGKWLMEHIDYKFNQAEDGQCSQKQLDDLFVLVGALSVLGMNEAAVNCKARLKQLQVE